MVNVVIKQIVINEMTEKEKDTVRRVLVESYQQYEQDFSDPDGWAEYLKNIKASVDNHDVDKILVAKSEGEILGTLQLYESSEKAYQRPELEIESPIIRLLAVHPSARGKGIAQELLKAGIEYARVKGAAHLYLHSSDIMSKAVRLYEWYGFKRDTSKEVSNHGRLVKCFRYDL